MPKPKIEFLEDVNNFYYEERTLDIEFYLLANQLRVTLNGDFDMCDLQELLDDFLVWQDEFSNKDKDNKLA